MQELSLYQGLDFSIVWPMGPTIARSEPDYQSMDFQLLIGGLRNTD